MKVEDCNWNRPLVHGRPLTESSKALRAMKPGDCKRICHDDVVCTYGVRGGYCSLAGILAMLRRENKEYFYEQYHEEAHVMVVRCSWNVHRKRREERC